MSADRHSFVVPAYGDSPHLAACLASLRAQHVQSRIAVTTSTPSPALARTVHDAGVDLIVNPLRRGPAEDWTFALQQARTPYVTLAHQDDRYLPDYAHRCLDAATAEPDSLIVFTDYLEETDRGVRGHTRNLRIKRLLRAPLYLGRRALRGRRRRWLLALGCPIPCPSVMYNRTRLDGFVFDARYRVNMDWDAWLRMTELAGAFTLVPEPLMIHRIHSASETTAALSSRRRHEEDLRIFSALWPPPLAGLLARLYAHAYVSNEEI